MNRPLTLGVFGTSRKENEKRLPIHPDHVADIDPALKSRLYFENGYAAHFDVASDWLDGHCAGVVPAKELFARCDILLLPKPIDADFPHFREGQILWGWPHCVQGRAITQVGIDKKMTFIAWEAMNEWRQDGAGGPLRWALHTFNRNNELAGYGSVHHAMGLLGITGHFGPKRRAAVIGFGATGRGAVLALRAMGVLDVTVYTKREITQVADQIHAVEYRRITHRAEDGLSTYVAAEDGREIPFGDELAGYDIIVNCELQDTDAPAIYVFNHETVKLKRNALLVDVSCDEGMGFEFAKPTSFKDPMFRVGDRVNYYAVDHSPSHFWNAATYEISRALTPYLPVVMAGAEAWEADDTIRQAIEIREGRIVNPKILSFQNREEDYPHKVR